MRRGVAESINMETITHVLKKDIILGGVNIINSGAFMEEETKMSEAEAIAGIEKFLNSVILVTAKDGRKFRGKLTHYDEHMNMILEDTEELSDKGPIKHRFVLLKGGNISDIST